MALDRSSYDILLALLHHAGEVVTKDELLEAGWPGRVVSENSLAKAISRLRQALGVDAGAIRSVHGYGYRLAAPTRFTASGEDDVPAPPDTAHLHPGDPLPARPGWRLGRRLGEGGASIVYLTQGPEGAPPRVAKLARGLSGLQGLKREIALTRYLHAVRPDLESVAPLLGWNLAHTPFFLERPFYPDGNLVDWAAARGGLDAIDLPTRLAMCIGLCDAIAELHEVGIIHRDLKPENLFPIEDPAQGWRLLVSDLGAGEALSPPQLHALGITMTLAAPTTSGQAGSILYIAPEAIAGELPTQRSDVFALGVLVYQMAVGNLRRSLAPGWEADVDDDLLREDIALAAAADPERRLLDARGLAERLRTLPARRRERATAARREAEQRQQALQLKRMMRRRRYFVAGSVAMATVLLLSSWQQRQTMSAKADAEQSARTASREAARSRALVAFLTDGVLRQADPFSDSGGSLTLRQAVDRAAKDVDKRFASDPAVSAAIHGTLGSAYEGMNQFDEAVAQYGLEARQLRRAPGIPPRQVADAQASLCTALLWQGNVAEARRACEAARLDYLSAGLAPDRAEVFLALADTREGHYHAALRRLEPRLDRIRRSGDDDVHGFALWFAGIAYRNLGRLRDAERVLAEMVPVRRRQAGSPSMQLAWALSDHGQALLALGREAEGRAQLEQASAMFAQVAGPGHPQAAVPGVHLAAHALDLGQWNRASDLARPTFATLLDGMGWQNWTIYAALTSLVAAAEAGQVDEAHRQMRRFDTDLVDRGGIQGYLFVPYWTAYAQAHLALGEVADARTFVEQLRAQSRSAEASAVLQGRVACFDARMLAARGAADVARRKALECRAKLAAAATERSPLLSIPDRILSVLPAPTPRAAAGHGSTER